jgi:hypothetical protein
VRLLILQVMMLMMLLLLLLHACMQGNPTNLPLPFCSYAAHDGR